MFESVPAAHSTLALSSGVCGVGGGGKIKVFLSLDDRELAANWDGLLEE